MGLLGSLMRIEAQLALIEERLDSLHTKVDRLTAAQKEEAAKPERTCWLAGKRPEDSPCG